MKITNMWAIINKNKAFNERHHHGNSALSAAYYVKAENNAGNIVFFDPRQANVFHHPSAKKANNLNGQIKSVTLNQEWFYFRVILSIKLRRIF